MSKLRIIHISDTHNHILSKIKLKGDILVHSGDLTLRGNLSEIVLALEELSLLGKNFQKVILVPGNHDWLFEQQPSLCKELCSEKNIVLLNDESYEFEGVKFWGSPITPTFYHWAFNRDPGSSIIKHWDLIPLCDVLITHGPPYGILDKTKSGDHAGCRDLLSYIEKLRPCLSLFGHIHEEGSKTHYDGHTLYSNGSLMNYNYKFVNNPVEIELEWINQKFVPNVK